MSTIDTSSNIFCNLCTAWVTTNETRRPDDKYDPVSDGGKVHFVAQGTGRFVPTRTLCNKLVRVQ